MALLAVLDKIDDLPKEIQAHYKKGEDGKFTLDVTPVNGFSLENVSGLKSALSKERQNLTDLQAKIEAFKDLDPKAARDALAKVEEMKSWKSDDKVKEQIKAIEQQLTEKWAKELEKVSNESKSLLTQLTEVLVDGEAAKALAAKKGNVKLLLPHVRARVKVEKDATSGKFVARVVDPATGVPLLTRKSNSTEPMPIEELVETMREQDDFKAAFEGAGSSGGGSQGGSGSGSPFKISEAEAGDPAKYRRVREAAAKAGQSVEITP